MGNTRNTAENILSTLSPEAAQTLESHFRQQVAQEIAGSLTKPAARKAERPVIESSQPRKGKGKRGKRDKGFSAFIRAYDAEHTVDGELPKANDVVAAAAEQGLTIKPFHVYNVRNQAKKAAAKALDAEAEAQRQEEIKAKRAAGLEKARAARAAKAAAANKQTAAKVEAPEAKPAPKKTGKRVESK
jgi:hypothetical protein